MLTRMKEQRNDVFWRALSREYNWENSTDRCSLYFSLYTDSFLKWRREIESGVSLFLKRIVGEELAENRCGYHGESSLTQRKGSLRRWKPLQENLGKDTDD
jgi:hypothetical protein